MANSVDDASGEGAGPNCGDALHLCDYPPLKYLRGYKGWQLGVVIAALGWVATSFIVLYFGRVVRYTRAKPDNIAARQNIRERVLALLSELHDKEYVRIIVVGHSLGSILAYDLISYFWAERQAARIVVNGTPEFEALREIDTALVIPHGLPLGRWRPIMRRKRSLRICSASARNPSATPSTPAG